MIIIMERNLFELNVSELMQIINIQLIFVADIHISLFIIFYFFPFL